jgi:hypothetical protein
MEEKNELYLLVLSILLGISVLKLTEVFQLAGQVKAMLTSLKTPGLSPAVVGVFVFVGGYIVFFVLVALAGYGIVQQLRIKEESATMVDLGPLVAMCVVALTVSYLVVFSVAMYGIVGH